MPFRRFRKASSFTPCRRPIPPRTSSSSAYAQRRSRSSCRSNARGRRSLDRHAVLRSSFHWKELDKPFQVVHSPVRLPFEQQDWSALSRDQQEDRLTDVPAGRPGPWLRPVSRAALSDGGDSPGTRGLAIGHQLSSRAARRVERGDRVQRGGRVLRRVLPGTGAVHRAGPAV